MFGARGTQFARWRDNDGNWQPPTDRFVVEGKIPPDWFPRDENGKRFSNNVFLPSNEVEGHAATMSQTFADGSRQWDTLCSWIGWQMWTDGWDDIGHILSHRYLSTWRSDPGAYVIALFPRIHVDAVLYRDGFESEARQLVTPSTTPPVVEPPNVPSVKLSERVTSLETLTQQQTEEIKRLTDWARGFGSS